VAESQAPAETLAEHAPKQKRRMPVIRGSAIFAYFEDKCVWTPAVFFRSILDPR
jgi:hypothetical protein